LGGKYLYKILVVDDEKIEREVIRFLLEKFDFPFEVNEACNGEEAVKMLKRNTYHVLLTDVKMPFMDGVELVKQARLLDPDILVVFFSGYSDFEYIKEAISIQVEDYILKPVNPEEFEKTITKVYGEILQQEEWKRKNTIMETSFRKYLLQQLIKNVSWEQIQNMYRGMDCSFLSNYHRILIIQMDKKKNYIPSEEVEDVYLHLQDILPKNCDYVKIDLFRSLIFFYGNKHYEKWYQELIRQIVSRLSQEREIQCSVVISDFFEDFNQIYKVYLETEKRLRKQYFFKENDDSKENLGIDANETSGEDYDYINKLRMDIEMYDDIGLKQHMKELIGHYGSQKYSHIYIRFMCTNVVKLLLDNLSRVENINFDEYAEQIQRMNHFSEVESILMPLVELLVLEFNENKKVSKNEVIIVKKYIHQHYSEDLSLQILSDEIHISPRYLSALFIDQEGIGINRYIRKVRMEKAHDLLLNTNMKIVDICCRVGYTNLSYFCKCFQEDYGFTPEKFRCSIINGNWR